MRGRAVAERITGWMVGLALLAGASDAPAQIAPQVGELEGAVEGEEGEALAFGVFVYGVDPPPTFTWDFGDGTDAVSATGLAGVSHEFLRGEETYTVRVSIQGGGVAETRSIEVLVRNAAPRIDFAEVQPDPRLEEPVRFTARAFDPGDDDLTWTWDFGDGSEPQTGRDLSEVSHRYAESGRYTATLTVSDGDRSTTREVLVTVGLDLVGEMVGAMEGPIEGESGATATFAGTVAANIPVPRISVGRTDEFCMVWMGFWDDARQVHVSFLWTPEFDRVFTPGDYPVFDLPGGEEIGANGVHAQFSYLGLPDSYAEAKAKAASGITETATNPMAALGIALEGFADLFRQAQSPQGDNWMLHGRGGSLSILEVSEDKVVARFQTDFQGVSLRGADDIALSAEGRFVFRPISDDTGMALRGCGGERPFTIERHTPGPNERLVNFLEPDVEVRFTRAFRPATVTDQTFQIGYLDEGGEFRTIAGELAVDDEARTIRFTPEEPLETMIYYRVRIRGGPQGILAQGGEELPDDYEWRFATGPRNVPGARGSGG